MAVALIALFVSLSGVAYGVATDSIGSREIRDNSLQSRDVKNGSLLAGDFRGMATPGNAPLARGSGHLPASGYGRFKNGPVFTADGPTDLLKLTLPRGRWLIFAKATVFVNVVQFECRVVAGTDFDRAELGNMIGSGREVLTLTVFHESAKQFTAKLRCPDNNPQAGYRVTDMKLHALRLASLTNTGG